MAKRPPEMTELIQENNKLRKSNEKMTRELRELRARYRAETERQSLAYSNLYSRFLELQHKDEPIFMAGIVEKEE